MSDTPSADVGHKTRRGIAWNLVGAVITNVMRIATVAILGRVLDASAFGVVAAALAIIVVLQQVRDIGIGTALVQRESLEPGHVSAAMGLSLYLGCALAIAIILAAPLVGDLYGIPEAVDVLRALGAIFFLRGFATAPLMLARRAMNFRAIAAIDALAYAIGSTASIVAALNGAGAWSLVIGYLIEESISTVALWFVQRPAFSLRIERRYLRDLLGYGIGHTIIQIANILAIQGDKFVVGRALGAAELGYFTRAYELVKLPALVFNNVVGNVLFPAFAKLQNDRPALATSFRRATLANALVLLPASATLIVIAPEAIHVVMGDQWDSAVLPFRILAFSMLMRTSYKVGAMAASAAGAVYAVAIANIIYMVCVIAGAAFSIQWGIVGVAVSTSAAILIIYVHCSYLGTKVSTLPGRETIAAHVPGLVIAIVVGAAAWGIAEALRANAVAVAITFSLVTIASIVTALAGIALWMRTGNDDARWLRGELARVVRKRR